MLTADNCTHYRVWCWCIESISSPRRCAGLTSNGIRLDISFGCPKKSVAIVAMHGRFEFIQLIRVNIRRIDRRPKLGMYLPGTAYYCLLGISWSHQKCSNGRAQRYTIRQIKFGCYLVSPLLRKHVRVKHLFIWSARVYDYSNGLEGRNNICIMCAPQNCTYRNA